MSAVDLPTAIRGAVNAPKAALLQHRHCDGRGLDIGPLDHPGHIEHSERVAIR